MFLIKAEMDSSVSGSGIIGTLYCTGIPDRIGSHSKYGKQSDVCEYNDKPG